MKNDLIAAVTQHVIEKNKDINISDSSVLEDAIEIAEFAVNWFKEHVWHDASEIPEPDKKLMFTNLFCKYSGSNWNITNAKWAYQADMMPSLDLFNVIKQNSGIIDTIKQVLIDNQVNMEAEQTEGLVNDEIQPEPEEK